MKINSGYIRLCIAERSMTLKDVENKGGIAPNSLASVLKRGSCSTVTAGRIARGLEIPVADILCGEEDKIDG